jgi:hypothetical protein
MNEVVIEFVRAERTRSKAACVCFNCNGKAGNWPQEDHPKSIAACARVYRGNEELVVLHEGIRTATLPLCRACYEGGAGTANKLMYTLFGNNSDGDVVKVSREIAVAMLEKQSSGSSEH